jgi:hypothetical protein
MGPGCDVVDMAQQTTADKSENPHYKIMRCPSDNSESPEVHQRGFTFRPAANDRAFELAGESDEYDYWAERDTDFRL